MGLRKAKANKPQSPDIAWLAVTLYCKQIPQQRTVAKLHRAIVNKATFQPKSAHKWKAPSYETLNLWVNHGVDIMGYPFLAQPWANLGLAYDEGRFDPEYKVFAESIEDARKILRQQVSAEAQRVLAGRLKQGGKERNKVSSKLLLELAELTKVVPFSAGNPPDIESLALYFAENLESFEQLVIKMKRVKQESAE